MTHPTRDTTLLLVRHTAVANPTGVLYGRLPRFALSRDGQQHAERVAAFLADAPITAIYSSPLLRARQTAAAIARRHPDAERHVSHLLHEVGSAWQGTPFADFASSFNTYDQRCANDDESLADIQRRMLAFVERVRRRHAGQTVVGVSHGDPLTILRVTLLGKPLTVAAIRGADYAALGSITELALASGSNAVSLRVLNALL